MARVTESGRWSPQAAGRHFLSQQDWQDGGVWWATRQRSCHQLPRRSTPARTRVTWLCCSCAPGPRDDKGQPQPFSEKPRAPAFALGLTSTALEQKLCNSEKWWDLSALKCKLKCKGSFDVRRKEAGGEPGEQERSSAFLGKGPQEEALPAQGIPRQRPGEGREEGFSDLGSGQHRVQIPAGPRTDRAMWGG